MRYIKRINQFFIKEGLSLIQSDLKRDIRDIFIELEDIGYDVYIGVTDNIDRIRVSLSNETNRENIDKEVIKDNFSMLIDLLSEKHTIKSYVYIYNYIENEEQVDKLIKGGGVLDPYQWIWKSSKSVDFPDELKYIVKIIIEIDL